MSSSLRARSCILLLTTVLASVIAASCKVARRSDAAAKSDATRALSTDGPSAGDGNGPAAALNVILD